MNIALALLACIAIYAVGAGTFIPQGIGIIVLIAAVVLIGWLVYK